ncbi:MAG TPA: anti-sigma factor antagonist [bacterium]|nr:anti-sigma factor antagonist [bacterium]HQO35532.1 anti-sigma factor antagonist [bacterium]HQP99391.1 anti-sigma factor antagonist [bacterium]
MSSPDERQISREIKNETLEFTGLEPILIEGPVTDSRIVAEGDLVLLGTVENSDLTSKKESVFLNMEVEDGTKLTNIQAKRNVYINSANDVSVEAGQCVYVEHSLIKAQAKAGDRIVTETDLGVILGGTLRAGTGIIGCDIGDAQGTPTSVEVEDFNGMVQAFRIHPNVTINIGGTVLVTEKKYSMVRARVETHGLSLDPVEPPSKELLIGKTEEGNRTILHLHGRLDGNTVDKFEKALAILQKMGKLPIVVDLHELTYISSVALRVFIDRIQTLGKEQFILTNPSPSATMVLRMTGLADLFGL